MGNKFRGLEDPDGNLYEIETDDTLEQAGIPADAATVGIKFSQILQEIAGLTLGYGANGKLYIYKNKKPIGTGIGVVNDETVSGTINEDNNLIFNDNIADGDYELYFLYDNKSYSDAMNIVVNKIVEEIAKTGNLISTFVDTDLVTIYNDIGYKEGVRISVSAGGETNAENVLLTGLIDLGDDGDVFHIRGVANVTSDSPSSTYQGLYLCYGINGALLHISSGLPAIPTSCIGTDENGDFTITMNHSEFTLLDETAYIRFQFGLSTGEVIMTRNELIPSTDTETDILGVNLLTSGDYEIQLNKRYSGSSFAYVDCAGMIAFMIPMEQVLNRRIRFTGFEYGAKAGSQPLWFTLDSANNSLGYLTGTSSTTGIWASEYLAQEDDGSCTFPVNASTLPTDGAVTMVINMAIDSSSAEITSIPDTMSIVIEEIA